MEKVKTATELAAEEIQAICAKYNVTITMNVVELPAQAVAVEDTSEEAK